MVHKKLSQAIILFFNMLLVSSYIMVARRRQLMPFWLSLLMAGERLLYSIERQDKIYFSFIY
jgi:hypothetical protein